MHEHPAEVSTRLSTVMDWSGSPAPASGAVRLSCRARRVRWGRAGRAGRTLGEGARPGEQRHLGAGGGPHQPPHLLGRPHHGQVERRGPVRVRHDGALRRRAPPEASALSLPAALVQGTSTRSLKLGAELDRCSFPCFKVAGKVQPTIA